MSYDSGKYGRQSIRLKGFDYGQSAIYFVTICVQNRECLFGSIARNVSDEKDAEIMLLNNAGKMVSEEWLALTLRFPSVILQDFIVMPNHFHGIICVSSNPTENLTLGNIIGAFKSITTNNYIAGVKTQDWQPFCKRLWQRNYYEHIVREDLALKRIQRYIRANPLSWQLDSLHPDIESKF